MNPIDQLKMEAEYVCGPLITTEFHAGGVFFCVPYEQIIRFSADGTLILFRRVIERFRPMDGQAEIDATNNFRKEGKYMLTDRNYIKCTIENITMIGLPLYENPHILAFDCTLSNIGAGYSMAFVLKDKK